MAHSLITCVEAVNHQLDLLPSSQKARIKKLKKTSKAQDGISEFCRCKSNQGFPFPLLFSIGNSKGNFSVMQNGRDQSNPRCFALGSIGQVNPDHPGHIFREHGIVRGRIEDCLFQTGATWSDDCYRYDGSRSNKSTSQGKNGEGHGRQLVMKTQTHMKVCSSGVGT